MKSEEEVQDDAPAGKSSSADPLKVHPQDHFFLLALVHRTSVLPVAIADQDLTGREGARRLWRRATVAALIHTVRTHPDLAIAAAVPSWEESEFAYLTWLHEHAEPARKGSTDPRHVKLRAAIDHYQPLIDTVEWIDGPKDAVIRVQRALGCSADEAKSEVMNKLFGTTKPPVTWDERAQRIRVDGISITKDLVDPRRIRKGPTEDAAELWDGVAEYSPPIEAADLLADSHSYIQSLPEATQPAYMAALANLTEGTTQRKAAKRYGVDQTAVSRALADLKRWLRDQAKRQDS